MAPIEAYQILGLFGPKVDPRQHAYDILPTYEITDDGFTITVHDLPVMDVERGGVIKLRWDEVTSIRPVSWPEAADYMAGMVHNPGSALDAQVKRSIETALFCEGKKEKPALYMTIIGREANKTLGMRGYSQAQGNFADLGVLTFIEGPELDYTVVFKKRNPGEMGDLIGAFEKAKGLLNVKF